MKAALSQTCRIMASENASSGIIVVGKYVFVCYYCCCTAVVVFGSTVTKQLATSSWLYRRIVCVFCVLASSVGSLRPADASRTPAPGCIGASYASSACSLLLSAACGGLISPPQPPLCCLYLFVLNSLRVGAGPHVFRKMRFFSIFLLITTSSLFFFVFKIMRRTSRRRRTGCW